MFQAIPLSYILRNLAVRRVTTLLTAAGMALVIYVFATVLMMSEGIRQAMVQTGQDDNVIVIRRSAGTEIQSQIDRNQAAVIEGDAAIATDARGQPLLSPEPVAIINLLRRESDQLANLTVRGTSDVGALLRPQTSLLSGRMFAPGTSEIIVGHHVYNGFRGMSLGEALHFAQRDWIIVGVFDGGNSGYDSEIWADSEQLMQAFRRTAYSSLIFRLADPASFATVRQRLESDPRLTVEAKREKTYYAEQSEQLSKFVTILGTTLAVIFSIGAIVGAMITMYASVSSRTSEIGTLRALGFSRWAVLAAFMYESLALGLAGGIVGLCAASLMQMVHVSTVNFQTFSELAFRFQLTGPIAGEVLIFALLMGLLGGFLPAIRAARLNIVDALRAA